MKKTIFSKGLYTESLKRLRVLGFIALAVLLIIQLAPVIFQIFDYMFYLENRSEYLNMYGTKSYTPESINFSTILISMPTVALAVTPLMTLIVFSVFNKRASSDFYHALPYTRPCIFVSFMAAVYTWAALICVICTAVGYLSMASLPMLFSIVYDGAFDLILTYVAIMLITGGAVALACSLTGTSLSNICVAGLILFLPRFIITIMTEWISSSADFLALNASQSSLLSPTINVFFAHFYGSLAFSNLTFENNLIPDIYSLCLGLVYLVLAFFVFARRKSETATQPAPDRITQHIIRVMLTMVIAIFSVILLLEGEIAGSIVVTLIALTLYFAYELITTKRWKNCVKALPALGALLGLCILCGVIMLCVPRIAATYTPASEDIDSVRLINDDGDRYFGFYNEDWYGKEAEKLEIKDPAVIKTVATALKENMDAYDKHGSVYTAYIGSNDKYSDTTRQTVAIKDGSTVRYRTIFFTEEQYSAILTALNSDKEYLDACMTLPKPIKNSIDFGSFDYYGDIDVSYKMKVFECLQEEIRTLSFEDWYNIATQHGTTYSPDEFSISYESDDYDSYYVYFNISSCYFPKTFDMLVCADGINIEERTAELETLIKIGKDVMEDKEKAPEGLEYMNIDVYAMYKDEAGEEQSYYMSMYYENYDRYSDDVVVGYESNPEHFLDLFNAAKAAEGKPDHNGYIRFIYSSYDSDKFEDLNGTVYFPLPENFDPEEFEMEKLLSNESEIVYEYYEE